MNKTITIKRIISKQVNTKYGESTKLGILGDDEQWYNCFQAQWNRDWREGDTITFDYKERQWEGRTFKDIQKPDPQKEVMHMLEKMMVKLAAIEIKLGIEGGSPAVEDDEEAPF